MFFPIIFVSIHFWWDCNPASTDYIQMEKNIIGITDLVNTRAKKKECCKAPKCPTTSNICPRTGGVVVKRSQICGGKKIVCSISHSSWHKQYIQKLDQHTYQEGDEHEGEPRTPSVPVSMETGFGPWTPKPSESLAMPLRGFHKKFRCLVAGPPLAEEGPGRWGGGDPDLTLSKR